MKPAPALARLNSDRPMRRFVELLAHLRRYHVLDDLQDELGPFACVITGGADRWAESWAWMEKVRHLKFAADWTGYGKRAGPIQNQIMIDEVKPDLVVAFHGGKGTADMVARARKAGIEVREPVVIELLARIDAPHFIGAAPCSI